MPAHDIAFLKSCLQTYCSAWSEPDIVRRRDILYGVVAEEVHYTDPGVDLYGIGALIAYIDKAMAKEPGGRIVLDRVVDAHHQVLYFTWKRLSGDGSLVFDGIDYCELSSDLTLRRIVGFFRP